MVAELLGVILQSSLADAEQPACSYAIGSTSFILSLCNLGQLTDAADADLRKPLDQFRVFKSLDPSGGNLYWMYDDDNVGSGWLFCRYLFDVLHNA